LIEVVQRTTVFQRWRPGSLVSPCMLAVHGTITLINPDDSRKQASETSHADVLPSGRLGRFTALRFARTAAFTWSAVARQRPLSPHAHLPSLSLPMREDQEHGAHWNDKLQKMLGGINLLVDEEVKTQFSNAFPGRCTTWPDQHERNSGGTTAHEDDELPPYSRLRPGVLKTRLPCGTKFTSDANRNCKTPVWARDKPHNRNFPEAHVGRPMFVATPWSKMRSR